MSEFDMNGDFNQDTSIFIKEEPVVVDSCHHKNHTKTDSESHEYIDCGGKFVPQAGENTSSCFNLENIKCENLEESSPFSSYVDQHLKPNVSTDSVCPLDSEISVIKESQCNVKEEDNSRFQQDDFVTGLGFNNDRFEMCDIQKNVETKFDSSAKCDCYHKEPDTIFDWKPDINILVKSEVDDNADSNKGDWHFLSYKDTDWNKSITTDDLQAKQNDQNTCTQVEESNCDCCALSIKENLSNNEDSLIEKKQGITYLSNSHISGANEDLISESFLSVHTPYSQPHTKISCMISRKITWQHCSQTNNEIEHTGLIQHEKTWKSLKPFKCSECSKCFNQKRYLKAHENIHKSIKLFKCSECSKCFTRNEHLKAHENTHKGLKPFKCSECSKCFTQKRNLTVHENTHKGLKPFKCSECSKCFTKKQDLTVHENTHKGLKPFKCSECFKCFAKKQNLKVHVNTHKGLKPFKCSECSKPFARKSDLIFHEKIHQGSKPFKCPGCSKCYTKKQHLTAHENTHKGLKPFKCSECSKPFTRKSDLTCHEKIHQGLKPFKCSECSKCFTLKQHLTTHENVHKGLKPFQCSECSKCFTQKQNLTVHENVHKVLKPFQCSEFSKCFTRKSDLACHEKIH